MDRELTDIERLAIAQTIFNKFGDIVSTKKPDSLRATVDEYYRDQFLENGSKSFEVRIDGEKVGTYSIRQTKAKPETSVMRFVVTDRDKALLSANSIPHEAWWSYIFLNLEDFLDWYLTETGDVLDGCEIVEDVTPATPAEYAGGTLKVDSQKVIDAVAKLNLDTSVFGLLED